MSKMKDKHMQRNKMHVIATKITQKIIFHEKKTKICDFRELWASIVIKGCQAIEISKRLHLQNNIRIC